MKIVWIVIFFIMVAAFTACNNRASTLKNANTNKKIIAYIYPSDSVIDTAKIDVNKLTHINYSFAKIANNKIAAGFPSDSINIELIRSYIEQKKSSCKLLISVGGWEFSDQFSDMSLKASSREEFILSVIDFMRYFKLDGVDVDWEYPGQAGKTNNFRKEDTENFTKLLKELRHSLDSISPIDDKHYITSIAAPSFSLFYENVQAPEVIKYLDFINLMAYDFYGEWEPVSGHQSNLYSENNPKSISTDSAVKLLISNKIAYDKIVLGMPFYSRSWKITEQSEGEKINNYGYGAGINSVYEELKADYINKNGYKSYWDTLAAVPYLWNDSLQVFVSYENTKSIGLKCSYIKSEQLAGAMFWKYNLEKENILLNVIFKELNFNNK